MDALFLTSCCRVCLTQEHIMIFIYDIVEEFNMTLADLLDQCGNLKIDSADIYSKLICTDCAEELLLVAKFREKCKASEETLSHLTDTLEPAELDKLHKDDNASAIRDEPAIADDEEQLLTDYKLAAINDELLLSGQIEEGIEEFDAPKYPEDFILYEMASLNDAEPTGGDALCSTVDEEPETMSTCVSMAGDRISVRRQSSLMECVDESVEQSTSLVETASVTVNHSCGFCGAGFMHLCNLKRHLLTHQESNQLFECDTCTMMFTCPIQYHTHIQSHQTDTKVPAEPFALLSRNQTFQPKLKRTTSHVLQPTATDADHAKRSPRKDHCCPHCDRRFVSNSLLTTHVRTHTGERPFGCTECDKTFNTRGGLDLHMRRHLGVKPYTCDICHKGFAESSNLRVHMRIHTGEKPHRCNRCSRSFSRVFLLQIHQRTHTGERPYACSVCNKAFSQQGDLAAHRRIHTGERPHQCELCGKGFIKSSALTGHMRRHERQSLKRDAAVEVEEYGEEVYANNNEEILS